MADIDVIFATNASEAAAAIDGAEKSTAKAASTAERFTRTQEKQGNSTAMSIKALRGAGLAAGLMGAEFGGAIGKVAGLATAGASMGGPWGAAIGAGIGLISVGIKSMGADAEETAKKIEDLKGKLEKAADARAGLEKAAAAEASGVNSRHGKSFREALGSGIDPQETLNKHKGSMLSPEQLLKLKSDGYSDSEIDAAARVTQYGGDVETNAQGLRARATNQSGLFGGSALPAYKEPELDAYEKRQLALMNDQDKSAEAAELDKINNFLNGRYQEAVMATRAATEGTLELLKKAVSAEGRLKVELKAVETAAKNPQPTGSHWTWGGWGSNY